MKNRLDMEMQSMNLDAEKKILDAVFARVDTAFAGGDAEKVRDGDYPHGTGRVRIARVPEEAGAPYQEHAEHMRKIYRGFLKRTAVIIGLLAVGATTVFAAERLSGLSVKRKGEYAADIQFDLTGEGYAVPEKIEIMSGQFSALPEGYEFYQGGDGIEKNGVENSFIRAIPMILDTAVEQDSFVGNVEELEHLTIGEHEAVRLHLSDGRSVYYVLYPECYYLVEFLMGSEPTREEALFAMENYELSSSGETDYVQNHDTWTNHRSESLAHEELAEDLRERDGSQDQPHTQGLKDKNAPKYDEAFIRGKFDSIEGIRKIGEEIVIGNVSVTVKEISVEDNLEKLTNEEWIRESWKQAVTEDGTFGMNEVLYIRKGDGISTKAEVVGTKEVAQKLLYVTVNVTNRSEQDLYDVLYYMECNFWKETEDGYTIYSYYPRDEELPKGAQTWEFTGAAGDFGGELYYCDVTKGGKNYIDTIPGGETVTLHIAYLLNEDSLKSAVLSFKRMVPGGTGIGFYVDPGLDGNVE